MFVACQRLAGIVPTLCVGLIGVFAGCSDGRLPTYPVTGIVGFADGSPVRTGTIEFKSFAHQGVQARGEIGADGHFHLGTYEPKDGAVLGKHGCVVVQLVVVEEVANFRPSTLGVVHPKHTKYSTSGLEFEVLAEPSNRIRVVVEMLPLPKASSNQVGPHEHTHQHVPGN